MLCSCASSRAPRLAYSFASLPLLTCSCNRRTATPANVPAPMSSFEAPAAAAASHSKAAAKRKSRDPEGEDACYICLDTTGELCRPCACPRVVHSQCLARWQLQQAGKREERFCRFCASELPDWKRTLTPATQQPQAPSLSQVQPVMVVTLGEHTHRITVTPGAEGVREFQQRIRSLFNIPVGTEFEVSFRCKAPVADTGRVPADMITLDGIRSFEAAAHCASLAAAQRLATGRGAVFAR